LKNMARNGLLAKHMRGPEGGLGPGIYCCEAVLSIVVMWPRGFASRWEEISGLQREAPAHKRRGDRTMYLFDASLNE
jgi:hypothetical protein